MAARKWMYMTVLAVFLISAFATGERIFFICAASFSGILLLTSLINLCAHTGLKLEQHLAESHVEVGGSAKLRVIVRNRTPFPVPELIISYAAPQGGLKTLVWIAPFEKIALTCELSCPHRGVYDVGLDEYSTVDMLGLTSKAGHFTPKIPLVVYPVLFDIDNLAKLPKDAEGESPRDGMLPALSISDIVPYVRGHTMRHMHWKLTARRSSLMMKVYEDETDAGIIMLIYCGHNGAPPNTRADIEDTMMSVAASICHAALRQALPVRVMGMSCASNYYGNKPEDFPALHLLFAKLPFDGVYRAADALLEADKLARQSSLIYITTLITPDMFDMLAAIGGSALRVIMVTDKNADKGVEKAVSDKGADEDNGMYADEIISSLMDRGIYALRLCPGENIAEKVREWEGGYVGTF